MSGGIARVTAHACPVAGFSVSCTTFIMLDLGSWIGSPRRSALQYISASDLPAVVRMLAQEYGAGHTLMTTITLPFGDMSIYPGFNPLKCNARYMYGAFHAIVASRLL